MSSLALSIFPAHAELLVATAADLAPLQAEMASEFQKLSGESLKFVTGASGMLARQIENGAPYDVYLSANRAFVTDLVNKGHILPGSVATYARGALGIWSKGGNVRSLQEAAQAPRLSIANPQHAPYGLAARQALERAGLWKSAETHLVMAENVRQTMQYAESGNTDAAITSWTLVKDKGGVKVPLDLHDPIEQAGGVLTQSKNRKRAEELIGYLMSPQGAALLQRHGLQPGGGVPPAGVPQMQTRYLSKDFALTADPTAKHWRRAPSVVAAAGRFGEPLPKHRTEIRSLWTPENLYFLFSGKFESLYLKRNPDTAKETWGLWEYDVAEVFIGYDLENIALYKEFEVSPQNEWIDLDVDRNRKGKEVDWLWNSNFKFKSKIDRKAGVWYCEMQIPWKSIDARKPAAGNELRLNLYRIEGGPKNRTYISWSPIHKPSFHTPEGFGLLKLVR